MSRTPYREAVDKIRLKMENNSDNAVHIYAFNVPENDLDQAHDLLDKDDQRRAMRVTYDNEHNFIVRHITGAVHQETHTFWSWLVLTALNDLTPAPHAPMPPGCMSIGATTFQFGDRRKQPDAGLRPTGSKKPSVVVEVGSSESFEQLKTDARLWIEDMAEVKLAIILSVDHSSDCQPNLPRITIQLWQGFLSQSLEKTREGCLVWEANWTQSATPMYILLTDIFGGQVPAVYADVDRVHLNTVAWRQAIHDAVLLQ